MVHLRDKAIVHQDGRVFFTENGDADVVLGSLDSKGECFVFARSCYEAHNYVYVASVVDGGILHSLELPYRWYLDGREPPKWHRGSEGLVVAVLGDPDDVTADPGVQSFYLWTVAEKRLIRLLGRGWMFHSPYSVDGDILRMIGRTGEIEEVRIDALPDARPSAVGYRAS